MRGSASDRTTGNNAGSSTKPAETQQKDEEVPVAPKNLPLPSSNPAAKHKIKEEDILPPAKRSKPNLTAQNFLGIGAMKAKQARCARKAARVGFQRSNKSKTSNTGSGVPQAQVIRLKYVKGFTEAVRTPARLDDLR